jgi:hypothetical protein
MPTVQLRMEETRLWGLWDLGSPGRKRFGASGDKKTSYALADANCLCGMGWRWKPLLCALGRGQEARS